MKKRFGQHLLTDKNFLNKIINSIDLNSNDTVLEIGAGTGLLTCLLAKKVKKVYAVELERDILKKLKENVKSNKNIEVVKNDFLELELSAFSSQLSALNIVGNIPYNITSKILLKVFGEIDAPAKHLQYIDKVYLMLQLEVAKRIISKPNTKLYSPLTILVQYFTSPEILFKAPASVFYPRPKVDSAFVSFNVKKKLQVVKNPTLLKNIIRTSFQQRRKKVINALNKLIGNKELLIKTFNELQLDSNLRAENLTFEQYLNISNNIYA
ncbi:MAG: ribosomal RNA small subunit methyltransferase A [Candidatus Melainabacteria bacterium]|nr:ribosomal RNA small subunit methyltransferase A [Candidatus Melainabacteria bacterium]